MRPRFAAHRQPDSKSGDPTRFGGRVRPTARRTAFGSSGSDALRRDDERATGSQPASSGTARPEGFGPKDPRHAIRGGSGGRLRPEPATDTRREANGGLRPEASDLPTGMEQTRGLRPKASDLPGGKQTRGLRPEASDRPPAGSRPEGFGPRRAARQATRRPEGFGPRRAICHRRGADPRASARGERPATRREESRRLRPDSSRHDARVRHTERLRPAGEPNALARREAMPTEATAIGDDATRRLRPEGRTTLRRGSDAKSMKARRHGDNATRRLRLEGPPRASARSGRKLAGSHTAFRQRRLPRRFRPKRSRESTSVLDRAATMLRHPSGSGVSGSHRRFGNAAFLRGFGRRGAATTLRCPSGPRRCFGIRVEAEFPAAIGDWPFRYSRAFGSWGRIVLRRSAKRFRSCSHAPPRFGGVALALRRRGCGASCRHRQRRPSEHRRVSAHRQTAPRRPTTRRRSAVTPALLSTDGFRPVGGRRFGAARRDERHGCSATGNATLF
jgi:hypothetical protein